MTTLQQNRFSLLLVITIIAVILAVLASSRQSGQPVQENSLLFPEFSDQVNAVNGISILSGGDTLELDVENDTWVVKQADNYPALFTRVREIAIGLSDMRIVAEKTANPEYYSELGVEDPRGESAGSYLLSVHADSGNPLLSVIVGKDRHSSSVAGRGGQYVRLPDSKHALLVEGKVDISIDPVDWIDTELIDIDPARIRHIEVASAGETYSLQRNAAGKLVLDIIPAGKQARPEYVINRQEGLLDNLRIEGVQASANLTEPENLTRTSITTNDGLNAVIHSWNTEEINYARFQFTYDPPAQQPGDQDDTEASEADDKLDVQAEVSILHDKTSGWTYRIPAWKYELFTRKLADLVEDIPEPEVEPEAEPEG